MGEGGGGGVGEGEKKKKKKRERVYITVCMQEDTTFQHMHSLLGQICSQKANDAATFLPKCLS